MIIINKIVILFRKVLKIVGKFFFEVVIIVVVINVVIGGCSWKDLKWVVYITV